MRDIIIRWRYRLVLQIHELICEKHQFFPNSFAREVVKLRLAWTFFKLAIADEVIQKL